MRDKLIKMKEETKEISISNIKEEEIKDDKEDYFDKLNISKIDFSLNEEDFDNDLKELENFLDKKMEKILKMKIKKFQN